MSTEIERKFLVKADSWRNQYYKKTHIVQGYLANTDRGSARIRIFENEASLNIKSMTLGITRTEYNYPIPVDDARNMLNQLCMKPLIEKIRYYVKHKQHTWEIDEFKGDNNGLIIAEIELGNAQESFDKPDWLGKEVSDDPRYYNVNLVENPYNQW